MGLESLNIMLSDVYFHLAYVFLLLSTVLITLLKPKQEYLEATEERVSELETETAALKRENGHAKREILNMAEGVEYFHAQLSKQKEESSAKTKKLASTIRELRNELLEVDNLKDEFLRNLQHESNTPLTAVLSKSNILFDSYDSLDSDTIKASIKDIINGSERLQSYVSNLVDTSKLTENAGSKLDKVIRVNLSKLVEERTKSFKKVFSDDKNKPRFKLDIEPDLMVECNEHYITQLLDNLISNADKYGENSVIEISLSKMNSIMVEFKITDHGIGIPKDEVYDIFKIFTNSSRTHSQAEGRGLGLALCHKVVEAHQGKIIAESDGEKGATFTFVIPFNYHFKGVKI